MPALLLLAAVLRFAPVSLFRWAGAKSHAVAIVAPLIVEHLSRHKEARLVSLFYGTGAIEREVGYALPHREQIAAEACPELISLYRTLQTERTEKLVAGVKIIDLLAGRSRAGYLRARKLHNDAVDVAAEDAIGHAARFLWLSRFCYRGLWRVNSKGQMNVPPDPERLRKVKLPALEELVSVRAQVAHTRFFHSFRAALGEARENDVILSDPPFMGTWAGYTAEPFRAGDHVELAALLKHSARTGPVIAFNSPAAADLYDGWSQRIEIARANHVGARKRKVNEGAVELVFVAGLPATKRKVA